jgi:hypothetical protein
VVETMDNEHFIARINRLLAERGTELPLMEPDSTPDSDAVAAWAAFLQACVKSGIQLSDPRWSQLRVVRRSPVTQLALEAGDTKGRDDEFKVGLQLLMGIFGAGDDS